MDTTRFRKTLAEPLEISPHITPTQYYGGGYGGGGICPDVYGGFYPC